MNSLAAAATFALMVLSAPAPISTLMVVPFLAQPAPLKRLQDRPLSAEPVAGAPTEEEQVPPEPPEVRLNPSRLLFRERQYYYERCSVELGPGFKTMTETFASSWRDERCALAVVDVPLPLGLVLQECAGLADGLTAPGKRIEVAEVTAGSNAEAAGVQVREAGASQSELKSLNLVGLGE
jgi:hypothetical protein